MRHQEQQPGDGREWCAAVKRCVWSSRLFRVLALAALLLGAFGADGQAIQVQEGTRRQAVFAGSGCGAVQVQRVSIPGGVRRVRGSADRGRDLTDAATGQIVARLTSRLVTSGLRRVVEFTATGTGDSCARPALYAASGWRTAPTEFSVGWLAQRRAFFRSFNDDATTKARYRPRLIRFADHGVIRVSGWSRWNGDRAFGRGQLSVDRRGTRSARVRIRLSEAGGCYGQIRYQLLQVRVVGRRPPGVRRNYSERFGC